MSARRRLLWLDAATSPTSNLGIQESHQACFGENVVGAFRKAPTLLYFHGMLHSWALTAHRLQKQSVSIRGPCRSIRAGSGTVPPPSAPQTGIGRFATLFFVHPNFSCFQYFSRARRVCTEGLFDGTGPISFVAGSISLIGASFTCTFA
jgi:hypothetical protein